MGAIATLGIREHYFEKRNILFGLPNIRSEEMLLSMLANASFAKMLSDIINRCLEIEKARFSGNHSTETTYMEVYLHIRETPKDAVTTKRIVLQELSDMPTLIETLYRNGRSVKLITTQLFVDGEAK